MPTLSIRGTWYGGGCQIFSSSQYGDYASLGSVSHTNFSIIQTGTGACGGHTFIVRDNNTGQTVFTSTSVVQSVSLFFDGQPPPPPSSKYDCINAACIPSTTYNTPGIYQSLSDCEQVCGPGCSGVCLSNADWAEIQGKAAQLRNKNCSK